MVRESEPDDGSNEGLDANTDDADTERGSRSQFDRRSFVKLAGAATAGVAGFLSASTATTAEEYETWTISSPTVYDLSDGEVLSNVLVDQTDPDASLMIRSRNVSGWEVRNVGFLGVGNNDQDAYQFQVSTPSGGNGLIENVWMNGKGDSSDGGGTQLGGILLRSSHGGHIDIRHTYIEGFGNNAVYASNPHPDDGGNGGTVTIENAFHRDNTVSQFRLGTDGSVVRNSVGIVNDPDGYRGDYINDSLDLSARGVWGRWDAEVTAENCAIHIDPDDYQPNSAYHTSNGSTLSIVNCDVNSDAPRQIREGSDCTVNVDGLGENPTVDVINEGVPLSPEMAASGGREMPTPSEMSGGSTTDWKTLTVDGTDAGRTDYSFTVDGDLEGTDLLNDDDVIDGSSATGSVNGGTDEYLFTGDVTDLSVDGDATILADGEQLDPANYTEVDWKTLTVDGTDTGWTDYSFTVSGDIDGTSSLGAGDTIDGSSAMGFVNGGTDEYLFTGDITDLTVDGGATILVDGTVVDPANYTEVDWKTLTVDGTDTGWTDYSFTVDGDLEGTDLLNVDDVIDGSSATGFVNGGTDEYLFTGNVTDLSVDGDATILADGEQLDPANYTEVDWKTLTVDGTDTGRTDYSFTVDGDLEGTDLLNVDDVIDGSSATGFVNGGTDEYLFTGNVTETYFDGDAAVLVDGEPIGVTRASAPTIDQHNVTEAGSRNGAVNVMVGWDVSDDDGDLSSVSVEIEDQNGSVVASETTGVSGDVAYGVDYFEIGDADGETFLARTSVTDSAGNQSSTSETFTE